MFASTRRPRSPLRALLVLAGLSLALSPVPGTAQSPAPAGPAFREDCQRMPYGGYYDELRKGYRIRLRTGRAPERRAGRILSTCGERMSVAFDGRSTAESVSLGDVTELEIFRGTRGHVGTGALIGTGAGVAGGLALGIGMASDAFFDANASDVAGIAILFGAGGALLGAGIGALVRTDRWRRLDPAKVRLGLSPGPRGGLALGLHLSLGGRASSAPARP